jgi:hypothetical protein
VTQQSFLDQLKSIGYKGMQSNGGNPDRNHLQEGSGAMDSFMLISAEGGRSNELLQNKQEIEEDAQEQ